MSQQIQESSLDKLHRCLQNKFKKAMVTGGAGFIGSHLIQELLRLNIKVISIDNYTSGKKRNIKGFLNHPRFQAVNCNVRNSARLKQYFKDVDIVFHQAASKKAICLKHPSQDLANNAQGTFNVLELSQRFGLKKVVHASTGSIYGQAQYLPIDENHPATPISYYGVSKLAGENYAKVFHHLYNLDVSILRYFHVYGPKQESADGIGGVVAIFIRRLLANQPLIIYGDGTQQRSFTFVQDVVRANLLVAAHNKTKGEVYNCASGMRITINQLINTLAKLLKKNKVKRVYKDWALGDTKNFDVDISKIKNIGFIPQVTFEQGLKKTIVWAKTVF